MMRPDPLDEAIAITVTALIIAFVIWSNLPA